MTSQVLSDCVTDLRDLIRGMAITDLGARVFGRFPDTITFPSARVYRTGGGTQPGTEALVDDAAIAVEVVGADATQRNTTDLIARTIASRLHQLPPATVQGGTRFLNVYVSSVLPIPDADATSHRQLLSLIVTCTPA